MQVKQQRLELDMDQQAGSKRNQEYVKEYVKTVYCHHTYLPSMQSTSCNSGLDKSQAGTKIARRSINSLRYVDDTSIMAESKKELKSLLMKVKEESKKASLKVNIQKMKIMASGPITLW